MSQSQFKQESNAIYIVQRAPKIVRVDLVYPQWKAKISELDYGVIPTSGTGVIRITGTDFANDKEHMAVEFFGKSCSNLTIIRSYESIECVVPPGQGIDRN